MNQFTPPVFQLGPPPAAMLDPEQVASIPDSSIATLSSCATAQSGTYAYYACALAQMTHERKRMLVEFRKVKKLAKDDARSTLKAAEKSGGPKVTVDMVEDAAMADPRVEVIERDVHEVELQCDTLDAVVRALEQRHNMLQTLSANQRNPNR